MYSEPAFTLSLIHPCAKNYCLSVYVLYTSVSHFEYKLCLHYKLLIFHTEIFACMFFYIYILGFLVVVRLLDLHVGAV
jgi:hypothetical protein